MFIVISRNNIGDDSVINNVDSLGTAESVAKKLRVTTNHMVCIDTANGERLKRWDRSLFANENKWRQVDVDKMEILGTIREVHRR